MVQFDNRAIGRTIRNLRNKKGVSQDVLSGLAGIARTHLTMIENGDKKANFETIWKIANALGMRTSVVRDWARVRRLLAWSSFQHSSASAS